MHFCFPRTYRRKKNAIPFCVRVYRGQTGAILLPICLQLMPVTSVRVHGTQNRRMPSMVDEPTPIGPDWEHHDHAPRFLLFTLASFYSAIQSKMWLYNVSNSFYRYMMH